MSDHRVSAGTVAAAARAANGVNGIAVLAGQSRARLMMRAALTMRAMTPSTIEQIAADKSKFAVKFFSCELERVQSEAGAQRCYLKMTAFIRSKL